MAHTLTMVIREFENTSPETEAPSMVCASKVMEALLSDTADDVSVSEVLSLTSSVWSFSPQPLSRARKRIQRKRQVL